MSIQLIPFVVPSSGIQLQVYNFQDNSESSQQPLEWINNNASKKKKRRGEYEPNPFNYSGSGISSSEDEKRPSNGKIQVLIDGEFREGQKSFKNKNQVQISEKHCSQFFADDSQFEGPDNKDLSAPQFFF